MENNFDKTIKKSLENFEEAYEPLNWDLMEEKIEAQDGHNADAEDVYLDGMVYDSLHNLQASYNPAHWEIMKDRLEDPYALRRRLMKYKVVEISLVALFIFTLIQFLPFNKIKNRAHKSVDSTTTVIAETTQANQVSTIPSTIQKQQNDLNSTNTIAQETSAQYNNNSGSATSTPQNEAQALNKTTSTTFISEASASEKNLANADLIPIIAESVLEENPTNTESEINDNDDLNANSTVSEKAFANIDLLNPILLKESDELTIPSIEEISSSAVFSDLKQPIKVRIGMALGPDANFVMTPYDKENSYEAFDQIAAGYSGGFTLGFQYSRLEIETGALYSAVTYGSRNIFEIKGSFAEGGYVRQGLQGAELDLIRLPLNLKYNFFEKQKWNFYVLSGASLNLAVETFYDFTTQNEGQSEASANFAGSNLRAPDEYRDKFHQASNDGVFEGGTLSKNTFLTANVGLGIERYFTPRMSIFLQPSYQHQFSKGLGPQSDQINSISILTGAKVTLKKRKKSKK